MVSQGELNIYDGVSLLVYTDIGGRELDATLIMA